MIWGEEINIQHPTREGDSSAFTMIELMLVVVIIGIITAAAVPMMAKSIQGRRLSTAARTIVSAGRYARSIAVMTQLPTMLSINIERGEVSVTSATAPVEPGPDLTEDDGDTVDSYPVDEYPDDTPAVTNMTGSAKVGLTRDIDPHVRIEEIVTDEIESLTEGLWSVVYERNGRCIPYSVRLSNKRGKSVTIHVDALSSATTEVDRGW